jgi:hypothetical protein
VGAGTTPRRAWLRFNVSGLPAGAAVTDARLLLRCNGNSTESGGIIRKFAPTTSTWSETQPTWNAPLAGADASADLSSLGPVAIGTTYAFTNLRSAVPGNGRVTFVIRSTVQDGAQYRSREHGVSGERPVLRVTYSTSALADKDADGLSDAVEGAFGYDPDDADQDKSGVVDGLDDWDGDGLSNAEEDWPGTPPAALAEESESRCGLTGFEVLVGLGLLHLFRTRPFRRLDGASRP